MKKEEVLQNGGDRLFKTYPSLEAVVRRVYPDFEWDATRFADFTKIPPGYWLNKRNLMKALDRAEAKLGIKHVCSSSSSLSSPPLFVIDLPIDNHSLAGGLVFGYNDGFKGIGGFSYKIDMAAPGQIFSRKVSRS